MAGLHASGHLGPSFDRYYSNIMRDVEANSDYPGGPCFCTASGRTVESGSLSLINTQSASGWKGLVQGSVDAYSDGPSSYLIHQFPVYDTHVWLRVT